jgi:hypothetical protein
MPKKVWIAMQTRGALRAALAACAVAVAVALCAAAPASAAGPLPLTAAPSSAQVRTPITFTVIVSAEIAPSPYTLDFGDGARITLPQPMFSFVHAYARAGQYTARVSDRFNTIRGTAVVTITEPAFQPGRTPIGQIYATTLTIPAVLAGGETSIVVRYAIGDATYAAGGAPILAYVELRTAKGALIRRSDPFAIVPAPSAGMQSAVIPYSVPVDAGGSYTLRVALRAAGGGTIASGALLPLLVASGPDPQPELHTEFHASGALEVGPNAVTGATFNPGTVVALQWPAYSLSLSGLYDPVSHRPDPVLVAESRAPGPMQPPDAAATVTPSPGPAASFKDTLGRGSAALPEILGGDSTMRGLDATRSVGPWVLHGAYGYTQLPTPGVPGERAAIADIGRTLGAGNVRAVLYQRDDDVPASYVAMPNVPGPLRASVAALDLKQPVVRNLTFTASVAASNATSLVQPASLADSSSRAELAYGLGSTNARFEYHNAGGAFATGAGPGATSDRAGWASSLAFALSPKMMLSLGAEQEHTHSIASRQTNATAQLNLTASATTQASIGVRRDTMSSPAAQITAGQVDAALGTALFGGQLNVNGTLVGLRDALSASNASTTRTAMVQFTRQQNAHTLGVGFTGTSQTGAAASAQTGESLTYGFPFGGRVVNGALLHGFELQFALTNDAASSAASATADRAFSTILSYHLTKHVALGVRGEIHRHSGTPSSMLGAKSALRLRLDVTQ